jgi:hypothetical protein
MSRTPSFFPNRCSTFSFSNWRSMLALLNPRFSKSAISEAPSSPVPSLRTKRPEHYASAPVLPSPRRSRRVLILCDRSTPVNFATKQLDIRQSWSGGFSGPRTVNRVPRPRSVRVGLGLNSSTSRL